LSAQTEEGLMQRIQRTIQSFIGEEPPPLATMDTSIQQAVAVMRGAGSSCVLVVSDVPHDLGRLLGIFTERDLINRVVAMGMRPEHTSLGQVMTKDPETLGVKDSIAFAINRMGEGGYRNVPIVDEAGLPIAVLNVPDVVRHLRDVFSGFLLTDGGEELSSPWTDIGGSG
jgi:CBS domain-containing protein